MVVALQFLVPVLYLAAMGAYARVFMAEREESVRGAAVTLLVVAIGAHTGLLFAIARQYERCPVSTIGEGIFFCAWLVAIIHLISETISGTRSLGVFTLLPTTIGAFLGAFMLEDGVLTAQYRDAFFVFHIIGAVAAYICFGFAAIMGCMYLALHRRLKQKTFDYAFKKLPPLDKLDGLCAAWTVIGSVAMILTYAAMWKWDQGREESALSLMQITALYLSLLVFIVAGVARRVAGFTGPRFVKTVLIGFAVFLLCVMGVHGGR